MNKSKKNNKKIIIIGMVILALVIIICLLIGDSTKNNTQIIKCSINNDGLYSTSFNTQKVTYVNDVFKSVEIEQHVSFKTNALKVPLRDLKNNLDSNLKEKFRILSDSSSYTVELEGNEIIMKLNITAEDYKIISFAEKESDNIIGEADDFYDKKDLFITQIEKQGGECIYE